MLAAQKAKSQAKKMRKKSKKKSSPFKWLIVIDFEATCFEKPLNRHKEQEIIEFPAVLINLESGEIEKEFHKYLRPIEKPELSDYCKNLTGISQETVDKGELFPDVMEEFKIWIKETIKEKGLILPKTRKSNLNGNCALVTWVMLLLIPPDPLLILLLMTLRVIGISSSNFETNVIERKSVDHRSLTNGLILKKFTLSEELSKDNSHLEMLLNARE